MTVLHQGLCFIDTRDREKKVFVSYFCSTPFPSLLHSLFLSGGSMYLRGDHQSNRLYYYFSTKCFDFQPTQKIKPSSSSLPSPSFPPTYLFFRLCSTFILISLHLSCISSQRALFFLYPF